jgi:hypothetical protein
MILGLIAVRGGGIYFFSGTFRHFRVLLVTFGHFWALLGTFGHFSALFGTFRTFSGTFGHFWALLGTFGHYQALSGTFGHYRALSGTIGHYRALSGSIGHYRALSGTYRPCHPKSRPSPTTAPVCDRQTHTHTMRHTDSDQPKAGPSEKIALCVTPGAVSDP